jgi:thiamine pyrophosphate-dependent acetolactate synthase large subunit-like protein
MNAMTEIGSELSQSHVFQAVARAVFEHGPVLFGLMGDANLFMIDHFVRGCGGRFVPAAHEGSAVLMALAYAHVSGTVGVATVTHGPALTNCITALTEGARGNMPIVLLAGDTPVSNPQHLQSIDQSEVVRATGAGFEQMRSPETATIDVARAFYRARVEHRPIVLNMPADFMWKEHLQQPAVLEVFEMPAFVPEGEAVDRAIGMIASARRPLILAGGGAIGARDALIRLADRLEAPLTTTLRAKNLFAGHPYAIDIFGTLSTPAAYDVIGKADCVICFGAGLHGFTTDRGALLRGKRVVQVDVDPRAIGRHLHPDAVLLADARLTAGNIVHWLDEAEIAPSGFTRELEPARLAQHPPGRPDRSRAGSVNFVWALDRLEQALPKNRVLVTDGGRFMTEVWCRISASDPRSFVPTAHFGSIGLGLQEAIGAGVAAPGRPVVLFTGDGGFMMGGLNEFNTAVRLGLDLIVVVCNDSAYGAEHIQFRDRNMDPGLTQFAWPSFSAVAEALGGTGVTVDSAEALDAALAAVTKRDRPILIDVRLDPNDIPRMRL